MPKISVIMPVYNTKEEYLRTAIESILNQTYKDFEFIIINDGSTDNSENIILSYDDTRISYIKNEQNLGLIKTLNKALSLAKGQYLARMDSDDISLPTRFAKQVEFLDSNPKTGIIGTWFQCFPKNRIIQGPANDKEIKENLLISSNIIGHPTVMFRKNIVDELNIRYDEKALYVEDYALWLSLIDKVSFANIPEILLNYRLTPGSICQTKKIEQNLNVAEITTKAQAKYFNIEAENILNAIEKLKKSQNISYKELLSIKYFADSVAKKAKEQNFSCEYEPNKIFRKYAIKKCKKDFGFLKLLLQNKLTIKAN